MRVRLEYLAGIGICESRAKRVGVRPGSRVAEFIFFRILPCPESPATSDGCLCCRIASRDENIEFPETGKMVTVHGVKTMILMQKQRFGDSKTVKFGFYSMMQMKRLHF